MNWIKGIAILASLLGLLLFVVINYSAVESRYECPGKLDTNGGPKIAIAFIKVESYRWWVHLWSKSDGAAWVELPDFNTEYYNRVIEAGDQLQFSDSQRYKGSLSLLSHLLFLDTSTGIFNGVCRPIKADA